MKITKKSFQAMFTRASFAGLLLMGGASVAQAQTSGSLSTAVSVNYSTAPWVITSGTGTYPDGGGVATFAEMVGNVAGTAASAATVTLDVPVTLSGVTFNTVFAYTLAAGTGSLSLSSTGTNTLNIPTSSFNTPTLLAIGSTISAPIGGGGTFGLTKTGTGTVTLTGTNTYTGGTFINGGTLRITTGDAALGSTVAGNDLSLNGGTMRVSTTALTTARNVTLGAGGGTLELLVAATLNGVVSGAGSLTAINGGALTLTAANTYTGATNVAALTLSGNGSILTSSAYDLTTTATLTNTGTNVTDRLKDTAAVTIHGLNFISTGNATAASSETIGAVTSTNGFSTFLVTPGATAANSLTMASLIRQNNSTFAFRGTGLGGTPGNTVANIYSTTAPTLSGGGGGAGSTAISIVPYAFGNNSATTTFSAAGLVGSSLVTYDVNGFRPLATAEYATAFGVSNFDNVRITAATAVPGTGVTANALLLAPATAAASALSGGPINLTSGAFLYSPTANVTGTVSAALNFGSAEGVITNTSLLNLSSVLTGSSGVTYTSGASGTPSTATISLTGASTYTGNTTLNSGSIGFSGTVAAAGNASVFGNSGTIVLAGGANTATLNATGAATLNRDISSIGTGVNYVSSAGSATFALNGNVSLANNLYIYGNSNTAAAAFIFNGNISGTGGIIDTTLGYSTYNGNNTFSGGVTLPASSTFVAGSDTAFGTGSIYISGAGTLMGAGTTARTLANPLFLAATATLGGTAPLTFTGGVTLDGSRSITITNTAGTTLSGVISNGALTKTGAGTLSLNSPTGNTYTGGTVETGAGALLLNNGSGSATGSGAVSIGAASALGGNFAITGVSSVAGRLSPGNSGVTLATAGVNAIGTAGFGSSLTLASTSNLVLEIGSNISTDQIKVGGALTLAGTVTVSTINGYTVQLGDTFDFVDAGSTTGAITTFNTSGVTFAPGVGFDTSNFAATGILTAIAVPEPGTLAVFGAAGALGIAGWLRRRRQAVRA